MTIKNISVGKKYTDKQGQEKTQWLTIGKLFVRDDGKMNIQMDAIPVNWNGSAMVFDMQTESSQAQAKPAKQAKGDLPF